MLCAASASLRARITQSCCFHPSSLQLHQINQLGNKRIAPLFIAYFFPLSLSTHAAVTNSANKQTSPGAAPSCPQPKAKLKCKALLYMELGTSSPCHLEHGEGQRAAPGRVEELRLWEPAPAQGPRGQDWGTLEEEESKKRRRCWNTIREQCIFIILTYRCLLLRRKQQISVF